ncbi:mycothiol system anti-sigma-R factor [Allokutzneria sp. NRRL B-24872]|uniref:mycothiol system anti-sigma-R factor n=1 Tax=Allokutzneria sp. NRRL B-24872 TaxID=1137961 RepID=UPI000A371418|nr:mycothiol system anti-sigma-R factor [Allokutzneria sp. NRRL B-24872]
MKDCGDHETDCSEVLSEVWLYLDQECDKTRRELLHRHLNECNPCLESYGIEEHIKALLARKCGGEHAPDTLKDRLRACIREQAEVIVQHGAEGTTVEIRHRKVEITEAEQ